MEKKIISIILGKMSDSLLPHQMELLEKVLHESFEQGNVVQNIDNNSLLMYFIAAKRTEGCSERTLQYYSKVLLNFSKRLRCDLVFANTNNLREGMTVLKLECNCSPISLDNYRRILSSFYGWLESENYIIKNPMKRIHKIKSPSTIKKVLTEENIEALRNEAEDNLRNRAMINLFLSSGIRVGELVKLNRDSVNFSEKSCIVFGKGSKEREVYFDTKTKVDLEKYLKSRNDNCPALFVTLRKHDGKYNRLKINSVESCIRLLGKKADVPNVHPHRFRRTMATKAIDKGMPIEQVQFLLGHMRIDTTLCYAKVQQRNVQISHQKIMS